MRVVGKADPGRREPGTSATRHDPRRVRLRRARESLDEALSALRDGGEDAKLLAGGHSLIPLMKLRLAAPSLLVDLRRVPGLTGIQRENGTSGSAR